MISKIFHFHERWFSHHLRRPIRSDKLTFVFRYPKAKDAFGIGHTKDNSVHDSHSLERRWSSRTFRYGYLVTTSPQLLIPPSAAGSLRLPHWLRVLPTLVVWRAVCTRPGNAFTATFWSAITSNSNFMQAGFSLQSELRFVLKDSLHLAVSLLSVPNHCSTCVAQVIRGMMIWRHPRLPPYCLRQSL